jgi:hypothetical protein
MENASKKSGARRASPKGSSAGSSAGKGASKARSKPASTAGASSSALTAVQISVADDYLTRFADVVGRVQKLGFEMEQELPDIGVMVGQMPAERVGELESVEGVGYFERPRSFQVPPPESDIQ